MKQQVWGYLVGVVALAGCASMAQVPEQERTFSQVYDAPGVVKQKLYEQTRLWVAESFRSAKDVTQYESAETGTIVVRGNTPYPCEGVECLAKSDYRVHFMMRFEAKDNKFKLTFEQLRMTAPPSGSFGGAYSSGLDVPVTQQGDLDAIKPVLLAFGQSIVKNLNQPADKPGSSAW